MKKFVFICGTARSGTSALWKLVVSHTKVAMGLERYINRALGEDFIDKELFEKKRFFALQKGDTFYESLDDYPYYKDLMERFDDCKLYGDKIPRLYEHYKILNQVFEKPKILFIIRNIFDVASSYNKRAEEGKNWPKNRDAIVAVRDWNKSVLQTLENFPSSDILVVEYEGLFSGMVNVQTIFDFLGLDYNDKVMDGFKELVRINASIKTKREAQLSEEDKRHISLHACFGAYRKLISLAQQQGRYVGVGISTITESSFNVDMKRTVTIKDQSKNRHQASGKYQAEDKEIVDYQYFELPSTGLFFRGPPPSSFSKGCYFACIGGAQTLGRFVEKPYGRLLSDNTQIDCLNLGHGGGKPAFYLTNPKLIDYLNRAQFVVVQVPSARAVENSVFEPVSVNNSFLRNKSHKEAAPLFADQAYAKLLKEAPSELVAIVVEETRNKYCEEMTELLKAIKVPKVLLWFSQREPEYKETIGSFHDLLGHYPHLVNQSVIGRLIPLCDEYVEVISSQGLPQNLVNRVTGEPVNVFPRAKEPNHNIYYPSPEMHELVFQKLSKLPLIKGNGRSFKAA